MVVKTLEHWTNAILNDLRDDQTAAERAMVVRGFVREIQADAVKGNGPTDAEMLLEYHTQQHCELRDIYDAMVSGDAKRNFLANQNK